MRFGDLGGNNGLYHPDTGLIELDIDPQHRGASNAFLFSVSHELGHAVKDRIGSKTWDEFAQYAVKVKGGETAITESGKTFSESDINSFFSNWNMKGIVAVGNQGDIFILIKGEKFDCYAASMYFCQAAQKLEKARENRNPNRYVAEMEKILKGMTRYGAEYVHGTAEIF